MELSEFLDNLIAQDYLAVFDTDGNTQTISKEKFIQLVKENN